MNSPHTHSNLALSNVKIAYNDTAGIDGISPMLFVFGLILQLPNNTKELPTQVERMKSIMLA